MCKDNSVQSVRNMEKDNVFEKINKVLWALLGGNKFETYLLQTSILRPETIQLFVRF